MKNWLIFFLLIPNICLANYISTTGVELPDPGSYCDIGPKTETIRIEYNYWTVRNICGKSIEHIFGYYYNACTLYGQPNLELIPKIDFWNVSQQFHDDLIKHEDTHTVKYCRDWHN